MASVGTGASLIIVDAEPLETASLRRSEGVHPIAKRAEVAAVKTSPAVWYRVGRCMKPE
jgi:hypothetical protein